ncbi:Ribosomal RNA large subunit methyltransferase N [uncultured Clostridium sp.]|uniref:Probable dual-specificity RNA methyltransferase RlmN n=1 Tax=Muricoprocola aceti TaxID=2981772 RepID=A0ABT2SK53_9FIRM|nr:23S rRNA (adenine(2503)-C(2))-methyltransferase RlmN [Muricoprocola aceti]MCQ4772705.1 23S rRNA (adenine(2503)-C(2))-methyltransferase RlmN [Lacrimispora saccharolytica]MCU6724884.1 23S rRNA (adenine(2503)-C(2))-methyltransferase RlmN [Muricoprocola aceti]SCH29990.1 Ribosomal RNA large subunit methyltransferase N [uncultured Clostridium sp.]
MEKKDLKSLSYQEMLDEMAAMGEKPFRGKQIYQWLHEKLVSTPDEMGNIPAKLKDRLKEAYTCSSLQMIDVFTSGIDGTQKYLFRLQDGNVIESVLMKYKHGNSVCVSSQVGCRMGCRFCASTLGGLTRNLQTGEILDQVYQIQKYSGERVSNLVLMGTGEPMDNYDNVVKFIRMLSDEHGLNISQRNITVSTCGIVPRIYDLAKEKLQITLALSLHAATQEKRKELMPIAYKYELGEVLEACRYYYEQTGRRLTFEYSLVGGVNDTDRDVQQLVGLVSGLNCHINLIPVNPIKERSYVQSNARVVANFKTKLEKCGINATIRREMGRDIGGACGQLRKSYIDGDLET